jgi:hypothetical protein
MELNLLEREVMAMLLTGNDPTLRVFAEQYRVAKVTRREMTGVGFYTTFAVPPEAPRFEGGKSFHFGDVEAQIGGLQHGAGFVLHVSNGTIDCLEGYSYDEPWPTNTDVFRLSYIGGSERDLPGLRREWQ